MAKWKKVGEIQKSKKGKLKLKVSSDTALKEGTWLELIDPRSSVKSLLDSGNITEEEAEKKLDFIKEWYKYDVFLVEDN